MRKRSASVVPSPGVQISPSTEEKPITHVLPNEIFDSVKDLPPLQRQSALDNYRGLHVDWTLALFRAEKHWGNKSLIQLSLSYNYGGGLPVLVFCKVKADSNKELFVTKQGASIRVLAEIESVDSGTTITLTKPSITILPPKQPANRTVRNATQKTRGKRKR